MIADIVQTGLASWWAPALAFVAGPRLVRVPVRVPARSGLRLLRLGRTSRRRRDPASACSRSCSSSRGSRSCSRCSVRSPGGSCRSSRETWANGWAARSCRDRPVHDRLRAPARLRHALHGAAPVPREGPAGRGGGVAARDGVRGGMDAVPGPRADGDPGDRGRRRARCAVSCCSSRTPSAWGFRSCSWGSVSSGSWARSAGSAVTTRGSPASRERCWSWWACLLVTGVFTRIVAPLARFAPGSVSCPHGIPLAPAPGSAPDRRILAKPHALLQPDHLATVHGPGVAHPALDAHRADPVADAGARFGGGVPGPPMAELAGARVPVPAGPPAGRRVLRASRALRRVRVVVVRADHDAAVRLARRVPVPAHARAGADAPPASGPGARDRRVPAVPGTRGLGRPRSRDRRLAPRAAPPPVPRGARRRRPAGARRREGRAPRGRELALPLGVPADRDRRDLRQGHRLHRQGGGGGGQDLDRRPGELRRRPAHGTVLQRRLHRCGAPSPGVRGHVSHRPASRWTSSRTWICWTRRATSPEQADIRVNHPASIDGVEFFQYGFGWAPVVEVREHGER